ncbi:MAG: GatB/YqeY domain-containing protein [Thermovenabulum sp.]|uniref:GatB/YqeY domain-containing protein n=1 Tax=Thermovenabulum sp. TaxID=3100335 RepID=UPI003C7BD43C
MSIKDVLNEDMKRALKQGEKEKLSVIRMARAAIINEEKNRMHELDDNEVIEVLSREVKKLKENKEEYERLNRPDAAAQLEREIEILLSYLPQQLTEEEIEEIARQIIYEIGANSIKDMGKVMNAIMPKVKGRADGRVVNQIVKKLLE